MSLEPSDELAIRNLLARYTHAIDVGTVEDWLDCFTEDGEFDASPVAHCQGRDQLKTFGSAVLGQTRHWLGNVWVDGDGDQATAHSYLLCVQPGLAGRTGPTAIYHDRLQKTEAGWRIAHRQSVFDEVPTRTIPVD